MPSPKVLVLGMDAAEPALLLQWAAEGRLPTLQKLLARGAHALTDNPRGLSGATWPSLVTGQGPGRHGRYYYAQLVSGTYHTEIREPRKYDHRPFWDDLSDAGKRVCIVDVPKSFSKELNGLIVVDWGNHDGDIVEGFGTWPADLAGPLRRDYGRDPFDNRRFTTRGPSDFAAFVDGLERCVERKLGLVEDMLEREPWDLLFAVWDEPHWAGHYGWKLHDPDHPQYDPALRAEVGDPLLRVYTAVDSAFGRLLERVDDDTHVVVLSSHGMGPGYQATAMLGDVLQRIQGVTSRRRDTYWRLRRIWDALPPPLQRGLQSGKQLVRESILAKDRANKRFFELPINNDTGAVRLNVVGREPDGKVAPGDVEPCLRQLEDELKALVNLDTGGPVVDDVVRPGRQYTGDQAHQLPDLAVVWNIAAPVFRASSATLGEFTHQLSHWRSGEHQLNGLILCAGPGVGSAARANQVRAEDVAPTVCALLGVAMDAADGRAVPELLPELLP